MISVNLRKGKSMTRQVMFVQGGGEGTHDEWDNRLVDSLGHELGLGYEILYPRMPDESDPDFQRWSLALEAEFAKLKPGAILVGHSLGATILIHTIAAKPPEHPIGAIFLLAAPFIGKGGWPSDEIAPHQTLGADLPTGVPIHLFHGTADDTAPPEHLDLYAKAVPQAAIHRLEGRNHQFDDNLHEVAQAIRSLS
jgi:predicted alpha/beta hydrolase family esterase